ncbi:MAG: trypsin-like peptidase domain-containing protein [Candidatus Taylorbacteria bacterium]|nr:trypsin-like peptidase domain-containing protein [Candidatus Taylorbacteria bacterium]
MNSQDYDKLTIDAVKKVAPSVVSIVISKHMPKVKSLYPAPFFGPFMFGETEGTEKVKVGGGSGFIVHPDGLVLTNKHVVFDTDAEYTIITVDGKEYPGKVVSCDPINDIAVVKINAKGLPAVRLGNSGKLEPGQTVIAIGNALGLFSNTVSKGIISGLSRKISASLGTGGQMEHLRGVLQTDVAINQGNSGGPLIDLDGEVVGINTAIIYGAQNIGFSIPINWAKEDLEDIIKHGRIIKPFIGLQYVMLGKELKEKYKLPVDYGALVVRDHVPGSVAVVPNSPAHKAGIKENDIITALNGNELTEEKDLQDMIQKCTVGDEIQLTVLRKDQKLNLKTKLVERK